MASLAALMAESDEERDDLRGRSARSPPATRGRISDVAEAARNGERSYNAQWAGKATERSPPRGRAAQRSPPRSMPSAQRRSPGREPYRHAAALAPAAAPALDEATLRGLSVLVQQLQSGCADVLPVLQLLQAQVTAAVQHVAQQRGSAGPHAAPPFWQEGERRGSPRGSRPERRSPRRRSRSPPRFYSRSRSHSRRRRSRSPPPRWRSRSWDRRSPSPQRRRSPPAQLPEGAFCGRWASLLRAADAHCVTVAQNGSSSSGQATRRRGFRNTCCRVHRRRGSSCSAWNARCAHERARASFSVTHTSSCACMQRRANVA